VAVVDTGVADLAGQVAERWRCDNTGCLPSTAAPTSAHGTEVASVVAALDDGAGSTGVAPAATIVAYRVDGAAGIPISYLHRALARIAADADVDVVNLSLGGSQWSQTEQDDVAALLDVGKVVVAAAGNTGDRAPQYPAAFPGVVSVGATDAAGHVADFSSFGKVDVVAPGECVAVAEVAGFNQDRGCPGDSRPGVASDSGGPLLARLALESSADERSPAGPAGAKRWAHGLVDAQAFVDAHDPQAPPALVLETTGEDGQGGYRPGSGDGQLPHPETIYRAYAFQLAPGGHRQPGLGQLHRGRPRHRRLRRRRRRGEDLPGRPGLRRPGPGAGRGDGHGHRRRPGGGRLGARAGPGRRRPGARGRPGRRRRRRLAAGRP
jgi:Subtilase family